MPCALVPDPVSQLPQQRSGVAARAGLVLAPLAMALLGLTTVDVDSAPAARDSRVVVAQQSAECIVARAVFAGAHVRRVAEPSH